MTKSLKWSCLALITLGAALWVINWWAGRPLFLDEANVVRNLHDKTFVGLLLPLDHKQYAPPLYLMAAKACGEAFDFGERALRLPSMVGGFLAIIGLVLAGKRLKLGWWLLLPLILAFINPVVLRFVGEVKPYSIDMGVAALLIAMALKQKAYSTYVWSLVGAMVIWISLPSIFVLGSIAIGSFLCTNDRSTKSTKQERFRWLLIGLTWLVSFALLYFTVLKPAIGSSYLNNYHQEFFIPVPQQNYPWQQLVTILLSLPIITFGFTGVAIAVGIVMIFRGFWDSTWYQRIIFFGPVLLVMFASSLGFYSMIPRLLLFILPGLWIAAALTSRRVLKLSLTYQYSLIFLWLVVIGGTNIVRHYWQPLSFSDARRLTTEFDEGYLPILHHGVVPTYDYYRRIHPETRQESVLEVQLSDIREQEFPGKYVLLYDVLTQGNIRESVQRDSIWAAARGCKVRTEAMFRAKAMYLDCGK